MTGYTVMPTQGGTSRETPSAGTFTGGLDGTAFLRLLLTELQYQDPMQPVKDTAFITQLAQFAELEQAQALSRLNQQTQAIGLLGRRVEVRDPETGTTVKGLVSRVEIKEGRPNLIVNSRPYPLSSLVSVTTR